VPFKVGDKVVIHPGNDLAGPCVLHHNNQVGTIIKVSDTDSGFPYTVDRPTLSGQEKSTIWREDELELYAEPEPVRQEQMTSSLRRFLVI
jgi:hypothetical protein